MLKTSGLVLDVHDDVGGEVLRTFFPKHADIPECIKQAHALSAGERERLPDDDFALVLLDGDQKLRKYACIDEGNTRLAVLYFAANAHKLPEEAQKVAAANLVTACNWYGVEIPEELEKVALGLVRGLQLMSLPSTAKGVSGQMKQNMTGIKEHEAAGHTVVPMNEIKHAEVSGTSLMPSQPPGNRAAKPSKIPVLKSASIMQPYVDVSTSNPASIHIEKKASRSALDECYPLDSYEQVKAASAYFEEYGKRFSPLERREYCLNLVKRANELNIDVSAEAQKYGSAGYASGEEIKAAFDVRRNALLDPVDLLVLGELEEKRATVSPDIFCTALEEFDKLAGLDQYYDRYVPDPFYTTYGVKCAESFSFIHSNDMVTEKDLERLGKTMHKSLCNSFGADFADEFRKDPVGIFKSMPLTQKKMIMHLATDNSPGAEIVP